MGADEDGRDRIGSLRRLAIGSLNSYRGGFADLARLDRDLEWTIRSLAEVADPSWVDSLFGHWNSLEIMYAGALSDERQDLTPEEEADVQETVAWFRTAFGDYELPLSPDEKPREHDVIRLRRPMPEHGLSAGSTGTVVVDYTMYSDGTLPPENAIPAAPPEPW